MELFKELNESRMYRRLAQMEGKTVHDIAERLFEHLLALQILCNIDMDYAARYANWMFRQPAFDGFRTSQPDLYNLFVMVLHQEKYEHIIENDLAVGVPEMRFRRNIRYITGGKFDNNDYSQMMLMMQRRFDKLPKMLITIRRQVSMWKTMDPSDQNTVIRRLLFQMREKAIQSDLFQYLNRKL